MLDRWALETLVYRGLVVSWRRLPPARESQAIETAVLQGATVKKRQEEEEEGRAVEARAGKASRREAPGQLPEQEGLQCFGGTEEGPGLTGDLQETDPPAGAAAGR